MAIGKDNGIIHLCGAVFSSPATWQTSFGTLVCWGYESRKWFPKVKDGTCDAFMNKDSDVKEILKCIEKRILDK
jgi:hypothetical protein